MNDRVREEIADRLRPLVGRQSEAGSSKIVASSPMNAVASVRSANEPRSTRSQR